MQKFFVVAFLFAIVFILISMDSQAQCSICTRTAQQLGEKPAKGLNAGIIYLASIPLILMGFIGYRFYKKTREEQ